MFRFRLSYSENKGFHRNLQMTFVEALLASDGQQGKEKLLTDILDL